MPAMSLRALGRLALPLLVLLALPVVAAKITAPANATVVGSVRLPTTLGYDEVVLLDGKVGLGLSDAEVAKWRFEAGTVLPTTKKLTLTTTKDGALEIVFYIFSAEEEAEVKVELNCTAHVAAGPKGTEKARVWFEAQANGVVLLKTTRRTECRPIPVCRLIATDRPGLTDDLPIPSVVHTRQL